MKLPKSRKRGDSYRIELMLGGKRISATRDTVKECEQWASQKMLEHKAHGKLAESKNTITYTELLAIYFAKVASKKPSSEHSRILMNAFLRDYEWLGVKQVHEITPKDLTKWRNDRLQEVSSGTVLREISFFSGVLSYAVKELFIIDTNPFSQVAKPKPPKARNRRISDEEIEAVLRACDYKRGQTPTQTMHYVAWVFLFAINTAMRRGEVLSITKDNIYDDYIHLPKTKNGDIRDVPLLNSAKEMLTWIDNDSNNLIPLSVNAFRLSWQRAQKRFDIGDLKFHDTRHEAISRLVNKQKVSVEILMKITGHKTSGILINTYYNPTASEISKQLNS